MVLIACHDKKRDRDARFADNVHHVLDEALHNIDRLCDPDVIHAFGIVGSEPCAHAARKKDRADLLFAQSLKTHLGEVLSLLLDLGDLHSSERRDLSSDLTAVRILCISDDREISFLDLIKKSFFLLISKFFVMIKNVKLSVFF